MIKYFESIIAHKTGIDFIKFNNMWYPRHEVNDHFKDLIETEYDVKL